MAYLTRCFMLAGCCFILSACSLLQNNPQANQKALCKELNYRIINNGATSNRLLATQQGAETANLNRTYHEEGC